MADGSGSTVMTVGLLKIIPFPLYIDKTRLLLPSIAKSLPASLLAGSPRKLCIFKIESGSYLPSRAVSSQVLSAYKGLTSVFEMRTGGSP